MSFIVLKFSELQKIIYFFLFIAFIIFLLIQGINLLGWLKLSIIQSITPSISLALIVLGFLLRSVTIQHERLANFIGKPIVHGLWKGSLISNYKNSEGYQIPPIEIYFYVKQTFLITTIKSFTSNQKSESVITALSQNKDTDTTTFLYTYKFYRTRNSENKVTFGSGDLNLTDNGKILTGIYWTNSNTCGEIVLNLIDRKCKNIDSFAMAQYHFSEIEKAM
ncbi:hypothetical protein [Acinetobacter sp. Ac_5812]|uniref:Cap15 family cyclic dinucleotide receptor domain-containing protein n=1 Tax=Acinetobacter sp. Ac_5812 TaxID=1848937 RepID=UPI00148FAAA9|nr:hypothetical protein [Acinetobacter sp. Ac_5812]